MERSLSGQSRKASLAEAISNIAVGFGVALVTQLVVFPWFGLHPKLEENMIIGSIFTAVSLVRSYCLRRLYNWWGTR